jgi:hypothetical protein
MTGEKTSFIAQKITGAEGPLLKNITAGKRNTENTGDVSLVVLFIRSLCIQFHFLFQCGEIYVI